MGYHIIKNDNTYVGWVRELEYSGNYHEDTHWYIESATDDIEAEGFKTYDVSTNSIIDDQPAIDEAKEIEVRYKRNDLLAETDWMAVGDRTTTQAERDYRQALRDVPQQSGFPHNVTWPTKP